VPVYTDGQERKEENFGAKQQGVGKERWVRIHNRACLQRRFPYGICLGDHRQHVSVASHCSGGKSPEQGLWNAREYVSAEVS
jgi:hypothetical protein